MTLGQKIKKLRNDKNLTQKELADQIYVTFQTVSKWEKDENEPDVATLRELAKLFGCSMDYLLSEEEVEAKEEKVEEVTPVVVPTEPVTKTVIIHQKELHVCARCKKDIPDGEVEIDHVCVRTPGRGRSAEYRDDYYHKECLEEVNKERKEADRLAKIAHGKHGRKLTFGWGIASGVVALVAALVVFLVVPQCKEYVHPGMAVVYSILIGYGIFAMIYCILSGSYICDVFTWCAGLSIKMPGIIFSWDIDGFIWAISMKIVLAIIGFTIGVLALIFAIFASAALASISFPFILVHNVATDYEDSF